jgi:hypothetical protein
VTNGDAARCFLIEGQGNTWREAFADADLFRRANAL